jgi:hypothetical protein
VLFHHEGTKGTKGTKNASTVQDAPQAVSQNLHVEVD